MLYLIRLPYIINYLSKNYWTKKKILQIKGGQRDNFKTISRRGIAPLNFFKGGICPPCPMAPPPLVLIKAFKHCILRNKYEEEI